MSDGKVAFKVIMAVFQQHGNLIALANPSVYKRVSQLPYSAAKLVIRKFCTVTKYCVLLRI
jgi:hypothetical protein